MVNGSVSEAISRNSNLYWSLMRNDERPFLSPMSRSLSLSLLIHHPSATLGWTYALNDAFSLEFGKVFLDSFGRDAYSLGK